MNTIEKNTKYFDIVNFIKEEYCFIIVTVLFLTLLLAGSVFILHKTTYESNILIKFPQYSNYIDLNSAKIIAKQTITNQVKSNIEKYKNINVDVSILKDSAILTVTIVGPTRVALQEFRNQFASKLLPSIRDLSRERFIYEWQQAQASSDLHLLYSDVEKSIFFSDPYVLNDQAEDVNLVKINWKKWSVTIVFLSFMIGCLVGIIHYFYFKK